MNKLSILLFGALAFGFTACEDSPEVPPVQSNPQPPMYESNQISAAKAGVFASTEVIDLEKYKADKLGVPVVSFSTTEAFPAGAYPSGTLEISNTSDYATSYKVPVEVTDGIGYATAYDWNVAMQEMFGRAHKEHEIFYRLTGYVNQDGGIYHIGAPNTYIFSGSANVMGFDIGVAISDAYYFLGGCTVWSVKPEDVVDYKMYHTSSESFYEDPIFRFYINIKPEQGECWWKIAPQEALTGNDETGYPMCLGPSEDGNTNLQGTLVEGSETGNAAGKIEGSGTYCIEFDAIAQTYNIYQTDVEIPYLFTPGVASGWERYSSQWLQWIGGKSAYMAPIKIDGEVKFMDIVAPGYGGTSWNICPNYGGADGKLVLGGENIKVDKTAIYFVTADLNNLTYDLTEVTSIGVIGVGGDWNNDIELTPSQDLLKWSAKVELKGEAWKIRFNHGWAYSYGNKINDLVFDGGNISGYEGTYTVTFDMTGNLPRIALSK